MSDKKQEEQDLVEANQLVAKAEELIYVIQRRLERLQTEGAPTKEAESILATMVESLAGLKFHRDVMADRLAKFKRSE
jgi:hypothetical protein